MDSTPTAPAAPATIRLEYTPTLDELVEGSLLPFRQQRIRGALFTALGGAALFLTGLLRKQPEDSLLILGALVAASTLFTPYFTRRNLRRYFASRRDSDQPNVVTLSPEGILTETSNGTTFIRWHAFDYFRETRRFILLYQGDGVSFLPKRAFESPEQLVACRDVLMHHIGRTAPTARRGFPIEPASPVAPPPAATGDANVAAENTRAQV